MNTQEILDLVTEISVNYGPRIVGAILIVIIGNIVIKAIGNSVGKILDKNGLDASLKLFITGFTKTLLKVLLVLSALSLLGFEMTSFIAILGAAGLAVGMALSGTLQNFAGGVMLLTFRPFKVGDVIDAQGYIGSVSEIQVFNTILKTPDNKTIIIPNGALSNSSMINYSTEEKRRVDWTFGVGYGDDLNTAQDLIQKLCNHDTRILKTPEVMIAVSELADSSVNFTVRAWVKAEDYWAVFFDMNKTVYEEFSKAGLNIPYPQMDVHVHSPTA